MDQHHVPAIEVIASLTPLQFFVEPGRETECAQGRKFSAPEFLFAVNLTDLRRFLHGPLQAGRTKS
jgi:hypothetical protein